MRGVVWTKYGPPEVLQLREVEKPAPKDTEVLIKIYASTVTAGDCEMRRLKFPIYLSLPLRMWLGFRKPRDMTIPGTELAGEVESVGKDVKLFKEGDQVFGSAGLGFGTNAQYKCLPEKPNGVEGALALKPANMSYEEAATVPFGGRDALHFLRNGNIQPGQKVLVNGAGGSIGTFAVQLAKHFGAEVTAVDSTGKLDMLRSIGADQVIDYTREDFTKSGETYDVIFDVIGKISLARSEKAMEQNGTYLLANPGLSQIVPGLWIRVKSSLPGRQTGKKVVMQPAGGTTEDLIYLKELIEAGKITTVIDRSFPLEQIVEAHRYVESGLKKGNVVITVAHDNDPIKGGM
jgi:NADPH:quinone reductase-like Zn-dependent oxidoreductase